MLLPNNNSSNFKSVALLICKLYISGHFQSVRLIFDSKNVNAVDELHEEVNFNCPTYIPVITSTQNSFDFWKQSSCTDQILELIFLNSLAVSMDRLSDCNVFYQIYIISSDGNKEDLIQNWNKSYDGRVFANSLLLLHNKTFDTAEVYSGNSEHSIHVPPDHNSTENNLFAETFGRLESLTILTIQYTHETSCHSEQQNKRFVFPIIQRFLANFYSSRMNITFLEGISTVCDGGLKFNYVRHQPYGVYKELFFEAETLNSEMMSESNLLNFNF